MVVDSRDFGDDHDLAAREVLLDRVFYFVHFDVTKFFTSGRCRMCGQLIGTAEAPGAQTSGFVTPMSVQYAGLPVSHFWAWICVACFERFESEMNWSRADGVPTDLPRDEVRAFRRAWNAHMREVREQDTEWSKRYPFARTGWNVEDVVGIARVHGLDISEQLAQQLLEEHEGTLHTAMDGAVAQVILALLRGEYRDDIGKESGENIAS